MMRRKDYGRRFPMRPIERPDLLEQYRSVTEELTEVLTTWTPPTVIRPFEETAPVMPAPYWHILPYAGSWTYSDGDTYTINSNSTNTERAA